MTGRHINYNTLSANSAIERSHLFPIRNYLAQRSRRLRYGNMDKDKDTQRGKSGDEGKHHYSSKETWR
jgi:hypothetical protein